jgi:predicted DNA-binding transcriptional regulator AlpA
MNLKLFSVPDLVKKWNYSRAGIRKLTQKSDFPQPVAIVSNGKVKLYSEMDILEYEKGKEWLFDENQKRRRQNLYLMLQTAKDFDDVGNTKEKDRILFRCFGKLKAMWTRKPNLSRSD